MAIIPIELKCDGQKKYGNNNLKGPDCNDGSDENFVDCCAEDNFAYDI